MYRTRIVLDSVNEATTDRLTTFELTYPRFVHSELMTHRLFSRNAASSRAIPIDRIIERVVDDPAMPVFWGKNQKGMQAAEELDKEAKHQARMAWFTARDNAVDSARALQAIGAHKQIVNRILEPFMWITTIVTATEYENWFALRNHKDAQPELAAVAASMWEAYQGSRPQVLEPGAWHLPYVYREDRDDVVNMLWQQYGLKGESAPVTADDCLCRISTGRCARVSYLTHGGKRSFTEDIRLHDQLTANGHWSPFEHPAMALNRQERWGNFVGFRQYRLFFANEHQGRDLQTIPWGPTRNDDRLAIVADTVTEGLKLHKEIA